MVVGKQDHCSRETELFRQVSGGWKTLSGTERFAQDRLTIRKYRADLGWSQEKLAEESGLHWTYIGGIERGERNVALLNIVRIAHALKVRPSALLDAIH